MVATPAAAARTLREDVAGAAPLDQTFTPEFEMTEDEKAEIAALFDA